MDARILFFLKNKCIKHQVQYQLLNMKKVIVSRRMITKHEQNVLKSGLNIITARNVKMRWIAKVMLENPKRQIFFYKTSCAITCIECKKSLFLRKKQETSCTVTCIGCGKQFLASRNVMNRKLQWMREYFILKNKFIKHQVEYHVLNMKKVIFSRKIRTIHEQNLLKSSLNIIPARNVKIRWIVKVIFFFLNHVL